MISEPACDRLDFGNATIPRKRSAPRRIDLAHSRGEAVLASHGALADPLARQELPLRFHVSVEVRRAGPRL